MLLLCLLLAVCTTGVAQPYYFRHYQTENGLSNNTVYCSIQGSDGFIWFGTKEGLNRFDGYRFKKIHHARIAQDKPNTEFVLSLHRDSKENLWVGSSQGLFLYNPETESLQPVVDSLRDVNAIQQDKKGRIWYIAIFTLHCYDPATNTDTAFPTEEYFPATSLAITPGGWMLATTENGFVYRWNTDAPGKERYDVFHLSAPPASRWVSRLYPENDSAVWVGTSNQGLKKLDLQTGRYTDVLSYNPDKTTIYIRDIKPYRQNEYWLATESGIFIYNTATGQISNLRKKFLDPYSLSDNAVYTLCADKEGGIWAGTFFGGINYHPHPFTYFHKYFPDNSAQSITGSAVREICEDQYRQLWIGTEDAGLNKLDPVTGKITQFRPTGQPGSISYSNIHGLLPDGNDLWIGTFEHGIDVMDIRTEKVYRHYIAGPGENRLRSNFALCFIRSRSGDLYAATSNGLAWYVKATDNFAVPPGAPGYGFIATLLEDHAGKIWVGSHNDGLYCYDPVNRVSVNYRYEKGNPNSISSNIINALYEDSTHQLWISTDGGGLCKLDASRTKFKTLTTRDGLPSNYIFKTIQDNRGQFWISTSRGLVSYNPADNNMQVYTKENGLLNEQFNYSSGYLQSDGTLYFGSIKGMISFNPDKFFANNFEPNLFITGLQVQNRDVLINRDSGWLKKSIVFTDKITLPYDRSSFSLDFAALSFTSPDLTEYSYKMDGLDKDWTYLKTNRKAYFTNLAPGSYTFRVRAAVNGKWSDRERTLSFEILPPFWATIWARMIYAAMALSLAYYIITTYHNRTQVKKEKEIYEAKIDFFTNIAHEIKTPLTLIKSPLENLREQWGEHADMKDDIQMMERNTNRLVSLVSQILDFRKTEAKGFRLEFSQENISAILEEAFLSFQSLAKKRHLQYTLEMPSTDIYAYADEEALNKIFYNLISNATKYAAERVLVQLLPVKEGENQVVVLFSNDGQLIPEDMADRIFEPFFRLKENHRQKGTGIGLSLARSLAELHGGRLFLQPRGDGVNLFVLELPAEQKIADKPAVHASQTSYQTN